MNESNAVFFIIGYFVGLALFLWICWAIFISICKAVARACRNDRDSRPEYAVDRNIKGEIVKRVKLPKR